MLGFRWIDWNLEKVAGHNVSPYEAEYVVNHAAPPYPRIIDDRKRLVWGQAQGGDYLQVIYLLDSEDEAFVIHARPLTEQEKRRLRRSLR